MSKEKPGWIPFASPFASRSAKQAPSDSRAAEGATHGSHGADDSPARDQVPQQPVPAKISLVYESRDKKLCIFEDAHGHLTAVRSSRLA